MVDKSSFPNFDIDEMYANLCRLEEDSSLENAVVEEDIGLKEDFWREMERSDDPFETLCFFISKGSLENI